MFKLIKTLFGYPQPKAQVAEPAPLAYAGEFKGVKYSPTAQEARDALQRASDLFERQIADPTMDQITRETAINMRNKIMRADPPGSTVVKYKHFLSPHTHLPVAIMYSDEAELLEYKIKYDLIGATECSF